MNGFSTVSLSPSGKLTLPNNDFIEASAGITQLISTGTNNLTVGWINDPEDGSLGFASIGLYNTGVAISASPSGGLGGNQWTFDTSGVLTFPSANRIYEDQDRLIIDGTNGDGYVEINGSASILIGYNSLANVVLGNANGGNQVDIVGEKMRILNTIVPTSSKGSSGDTAGQIAVNNGYVYYCTGDYTNGDADIWRRVAWSNDTW